MDELKLAYTTPLGRAYQGDSRKLLENLEHVPDESIDLIVTSPPFALTRKKSYGNEEASEFVDWFKTFLPGFKRVLSQSGSLVIDIGGAYLPGSPRRSTYQFQLAIEIDKVLPMCQEFFWFNPAKLPSPAEWVNVRRIRVKDSVNLVLWFAKDPSNTKADNRKVLKNYSDSMKSLLKSGYQYQVRPSGHDISAKFQKNNGGAISSNLLGASSDGDVDLVGTQFEAGYESLIAFANTSSNGRYFKEMKARGLKPHPARFPESLPAFFIEFLTEPGDVVLDPFAGSGTTAFVAETLDRKWITCDLDQEGKQSGQYVRTSAFRFDSVKLSKDFAYEPQGDFKPDVKKTLRDK